MISFDIETILELLLKKNKGSGFLLSSEDGGPRNSNDLKQYKVHLPVMVKEQYQILKIIVG